jgi:Ca2+-binding RTX toxin-like protein
MSATIDLVTIAAGTGGFVIHGQDAGDRSGFSVASAGDVNGDGFDDLIIGAEFGDAAGNGKTDAGDSYVVFGKAGGWGAAIDLTTIAAGTGGFVIHGQEAGDRSGNSVASAGDVNGDGFDDLVIGARLGDAAGNAKGQAGESYVVFGKASGWAAAIDLTIIAGGTGGFVIHGQDALDEAGRSVASAGDVNGDGFDDLIIGADGGDAAGNAKPGAGASHVVFGKATGWGAAIDLNALGSGGFVIHGQDGGDRSGFSVASAGDVNGDGFDDLIIGAYRGDAAGNAKADAGDSYVVFGKAGGFGAAIDLTDVALGTGGFVIHGEGTGDRSGFSVASAGDVNGDGFDDLIIGAYLGDAALNGKTDAGDSYVVFGKGAGWAAAIDLTTIAGGTGGFVIRGQDGFDHSGISVASAGDVNGDGFDDLIIGARFGDAAGNAKAFAGDSYVMFGKAGGFGAAIDLATIAAGTGGFVIHGQDAGDQSGFSVASAGDIDGDGFDDLIIGADRGDAALNAKADAGDSYVIFGRDFTATVTRAGTTAADTLTGTAGADIIVAGQGDDTILGQGGADALRGGAGNDRIEITDLAFLRVDGGSGTDTLVLAGSGLTLDLAAIPNPRLQGIEAIELGSNTLRVTALEVLNLSDSSNTLRVTGNAGFGVQFEDSGWVKGATAAGFTTWTNGQATLLQQGVSIAFAAIDLADVAAGTGGFVIHGQDGGDGSGWSVASAGDIDGDGFDDLIIGAFLGDAAGNAKGQAGDSYVVFGKASGWAAAIDLTTIAGGTGGFVIHGQDAEDRSGISVASAGDVNGDGFDDLIIGAPGGDAAGNAKDRAGDSYVVFGKATGWGAAIDLADVAAGTGGFVIHGQDVLDEAGRSVASAGDVNGDGFDDLIIGAQLGDAAGNGKDDAGDSYVVFGKASGWGAAIDLADVAGGTGGFVIHGQDAEDGAGRSVASAGDVNGDGFDDLIIGADRGDAAGNGKTDAGDSYVVFGKAGGWGAAIDLTTIAGGTGGFVIHGQEASDRSGNSVASAGDVNGDGFDDLIIGALLGDAAGNAKANAGDSYVVFGKASGWAAAIDLTTIAGGTGGFVIHGQDAEDEAGRSVASAGDVNGDGFDDLIIGANFGDAAGNGKTDAGDSYVVFGKAGGWGAAIDLTTIAAGTGGFVIHGQEASDRSGNSVASAGDVNGDGFDDLIIGAHLGDAAGNAKPGAGDSYVIFGRDFTATVTHAGTAAAETLTGSAGADIIVAGQGDDTILGQGGADALEGGAGNDRIEVSDLAFLRVDGGSGLDTLVLAGSGLTLNLANIPNPRLQGIEAIELGANTLRVTALEVLNLSDSANGLRVTGSAGYTLLFDDDGWVTGANGVVFGSFLGLDDTTVVHVTTYAKGQAGLLMLAILGTVSEGADTLDGTPGTDSFDMLGGNDLVRGLGGADQLLGGDGADTLDGGADNDALVGGSGADRLLGGTGDDSFVVDDAGDVVVETLNAGIDTVLAEVNWTLGGHIENLILLGSAISGTGNSLANAITGNAQANTLNGGGRADTLAGGAGNDTYLIDATDILVEQAGGGLDTVVLSASFTLPQHIEVLRFNGTANARGDGNDSDNFILGNIGNNRLIGYGGNDTLNGGAGNDTLSGGEGADSLVGGTGTDRLDGGNGNDVYVLGDLDVVIEAANAGIDTVLASISLTLMANVENLSLLDSANLTGTGNALANVILGNAGSNTLLGLGGADSLVGAGGNDTLVGGAEADTLSGGGGLDRFVYANALEGNDVITDYRVADDTLEVSALGFGGGLAIGMDVVAVGRYVANTSGLATSAAGTGQFVFETDARVLWWDADGAGGSDALRIAILTNVAGFVGTEIVVVA